MGNHLRIAVFAYACEPGRGSEPGAGWVMSRMIARLGETSVLTTSEARISIERALKEIPESDKLHFIYVDLPGWATSWKKGHRGIRLHYLLWQVAALRTARRMHKAEPFDLSWHVTFSTVWLGSFLQFLDVPFVYGPVGGGVTPPLRLLRDLGFRGVLYEIARMFVNRIGRHLNPIARSAWRNASLILVQNDETRGWIPRRHRHKARAFHHVALEEQGDLPPRRANNPPTAIFAGRLVALKGVSLAVRAVAKTSDWRLVIYGRGAEENRLRDLASRLGIKDRVEFRGWVARDELFRALYEDADLFLFPCLHEEGGWAVAEAVSTGLPVVYLDQGGPPLIVKDAGVGVDVHQKPDDVVRALALALDEALKKTVSLVGVPVEPLTIDGRYAELERLIVESEVLHSTSEQRDGPR